MIRLTLHLPNATTDIESRYIYMKPSAISVIRPSGEDFTWVGLGADGELKVEESAVEVLRLQAAWEERYSLFELSGCNVHAFVFMNKYGVVRIAMASVIAAADEVADA